MNIGLLFWIVLIIAILFGGWVGFGLGYFWIGQNLVTALLLTLLGWKCFGPPIKNE